MLVPSNAHERSENVRVRGRLLVFALLTAVAVAAGLLTDVRQWLHTEELRAHARALGPWAPALLVAAGVLTPLAMLPRWPIAFAGGMLYGLGWGVLLANVSSTAGAWLQFELARNALSVPGGRLGRAMQSWRAYLEPPDRAFTALVLLRIFPLSNFVATNLLAGMLRLARPTYLTATFLGMLPSTLMYAAWGKLVRKPGTGFYALVAGTLAFLVFGTFLAQRRLRSWRRERGNRE